MDSKNSNSSDVTTTKNSFLLSALKQIWQYIVRIVIRHPWKVAVAAAVLLTQFFEVALIQRKFDVFTGGFLQPYNLANIKDAAVFVISGIWVDFIIFGGIAFVCFVITSIFKKKHVLVAFQFLLISSIASLSILVAKYKVLSYFSDAINFTLAKNLAGGNLGEAMLYALDESIVVILFFVFSAALAIYSYRLFRKHVNNYIHDFKQEPLSLKYNGTVVIVAIVLTVILVKQIQKKDEFRYFLNKKTTYYVLNSWLDWVTDIDNDGYGFFSYPADTDPTNANIYPGAIDVPNNGIDEDGLLGDFKYSAGALSFQEISAVNSRYKNIIMVVLESGREDLLRATINNQPVAPNIQAIANEGSIITHAYSHTGFTVSSLKILFNGNMLFQANNNSLFDIFKKMDFNISIFSGQAESFGKISEDTNMKKNADYFFDATTAIEDRVYSSKEPGSLRLSENRITTEFLNYFDSIDLSPQSENQFVYINLQAAHFPYSHPKMEKILIKDFLPRSDINMDNKKRLVETYWNSIANADKAIATIVNYLKQKNVYEDTLLIVLSDHGESLFDDGFLGHGHQTNDIQTRIPLVLNKPGFNIDTPIGQKDIKELILKVIDRKLDLEQVNDHYRIQANEVFQYVGTIKKPPIIRYFIEPGQKIEFNLNRGNLFLVNDMSWKTVDDIQTDEKYKNQFKDLVFYWEKLKWEQHNLKEKNNLTENTASLDHH